MRRASGLLVLVALLAVSGSARAHEFWIEPSRYEPAPGELVKLRLLVGQNLEGEGVPRNEVWIEKFEALRDGTAAKVVGLDGSDPAGLIRPDREGGLVVAYGSLPTYIEIEAAKFETYLATEGLDEPRAARAKAGASGSAGRERFSRCAKTLLAVGGRSGPASTVPAGLPLEIVPEADPHGVKPGGTLTVRLLFLGKPLAKALVRARDRAEPDRPIEVRTDASGRAILSLPRAGAWLIGAVHMIPVRGDPRADWESFWASLTFDLPAGKLASSPAAAIVTLLLGVALGGAGFLRYTVRVASDNNDLLLEADAKRVPMSGAMPISSMVSTPFAFALGTPLGLLATYLTLTGLLRSVAAAVGESRPDPVLGGLVAGARGLARRREHAAAARARETMEGPEVADRVVLPARLGIAGADLVVVASRRKPAWTPGTVLDCDGRWYRVGDAIERSFPVGLRTLYPLMETTDAEVFRRLVPYVLPPLPPAD